MSAARPNGVLAIVGATATGKSELAVAVAERLKGEVVSADAFAVYRGFDAGTAKPSACLLSRVPHHLVDARDPREPWSAGEFTAQARSLCEEILGRGRLPILAGGTGFYVRAFFGGLDAQVVQHAQGLPGEDAYLRVVPLALQLGDHHERKDYFVLAET